MQRCPALHRSRQTQRCLRTTRRHLCSSCDVLPWRVAPQLSPGRQGSTTRMYGWRDACRVEATPLSCRGCRERPRRTASRSGLRSNTPSNLRFHTKLCAVQIHGTRTAAHGSGGSKRAAADGPHVRRASTASAVCWRSSSETACDVPMGRPPPTMTSVPMGVAEKHATCVAGPQACQSSPAKFKLLIGIQQLAALSAPLSHIAPSCTLDSQQHSAHILIHALILGAQSSTCAQRAGQSRATRDSASISSSAIAFCCASLLACTTGSSFVSLPVTIDLSLVDTRT